ncbi:DUF4271 domain-containing protein [Chryseobacterium sp.]|uniref:DUF4271 domain-containing protein n=1 Tax=Chryseobacterium sp. TaxID=1871047 RepID=UPI0012A86174|nr:DUF4271 domain-containing protein [Chryseobacterium sp.]QFG52114.1 DUF4271 domain-containing protein [Chryseobacterium sp.]
MFQLTAVTGFTNQLRLTESHDWVIALLLASCFLYVFMLSSLHRGINLKRFLMQDFADASNVIVTWAIVSLVLCLSAAALISQYVPTVPRFLSLPGFLGLQFNKFGFTFLALVLFYLVKAMLSYLFYQSVGFSRRWNAFCFTATRFYFVLSLVLMGLCISHYYFPIDKSEALIYYISFFGFVFIFKTVYYIFHKNHILPNEWYYKFLYICTLQFIPVLALWKLLFF